ncbi:iron complex outermembrane receptor protein [Parabacteroides sp. PFB2-12]|uniref:TonB-dependent receptor n=1 Tax=unclassified Parabacteroides TaxID=2649774 RepID=UPI0024757BA0|nr:MULTISPECIES: TonB-dependent receptor [unclassified Parabacteroides]MDH6344035.1 iron complex outermembrane receptor protein [Parabacteroides sp. PM6-13]MDH6391895.1 iron complex outermembrane receptor protein [Parabacteroides sp. PFB2-12]
MRKRKAGMLLCLALLATPFLRAEKEIPHENDTIKTYNLDAIVVTSSTKETNNLRKLPGSVSILSPQLINGRQIDALKDISAFVPNLYIPDYGSKMTSAIYIRGIGARSSGQSVGLYVDNIPYLDKSTFDFEFADIQRIEVMRGPQGTLYGRNAMGGIVNIYTLSPFDFQGTKLSVSAGNYGQLKVKASHYNKLSETTGLSVSAYYDRNDGFFTNEYTGKKADGEESAGGRLKFDWRITPRLTAAYTFSYDYADQGAFPYGKYNKETGKTAPVMLNDPSSYKRNTLANHLQLEYKTDRILLTSTTGFQWMKDDMRMDQDYDTTSVFTLNQRQLQRAWSEEIAIKSNHTGNWQWSFGLYGFYNQLNTEGPVTFKKDGMQMFQSIFDEIKAPIALNVTGDELYIPGSFETPSYGTALFHQSTINNLFTPGLSLTAGLRLDYEKQEMTYRSNGKMMLSGKMPGPSPAIDLSSWYDETVIDEQVSQDFWQVLPKVSLKYECTPSTFTYLSVAKGYKTGGYNVQMSADIMKDHMKYDMMNAFNQKFQEMHMNITLPVETPAPLEEVMSYKPEKSWNYELGIRSELIENRLHAEATLFYMDIKDLQLTKFVESGSGRVLTNAGKAESYGVELSLRAQLFEDLSADVNYGYTHATFKDYNDGINDYAGKFIPYTPRHTLSLGLQYNKLLRNSWIDQLTASAQYNGAGKIFWTEQNDVTQTFYGLLNAKVGVRKGIVNLSLWGRNLLDTDYATFYVESKSTNNQNSAFMQLGKPLQVGAEISIAF